MLKDVVISLTENFHDLGHHASSVDTMMDSVSGMGHRIKHGHDMQGLIEAYHLEGFEGIGLWFDHMAKDFTSPAGIPLPFAEAIYNMSGMPMDTAIDWLTVNAYDGISLITQEVALKLFKNNKKAFNMTFILGSAIGLVDDNPLVVVVNTLRLLQSGKLQRLITDNQLQFFERTGKIIGRISIGTAATTLGFAAVGVNVPELIEQGFDWLDAADQAANVADIVDGLSSFGIMLAVSKGIKMTANSINGTLQEQVEQSEEKLALLTALKNKAISGGSTTEINVLIEEIKDQNLLPHDKSAGALS